MDISQDENEADPTVTLVVKIGKAEDCIVSKLYGESL